MDIFLLCDCFWLDHMSAGHCPVLRIWVVAMASGRGHIAFFEYASVSPLSFSFYFILPSPNSGRFNLFSSGVLLTFDRNLRSHTPSCASAEWRLGRWLIHCLWKTPAGPNSSDPPHTSLWFFCHDHCRSAVIAAEIFFLFLVLFDIRYSCRKLLGDVWRCFVQDVEDLVYGTVAPLPARSFVYSCMTDKRYFL
jgi:hypothetical protein